MSIPLDTPTTTKYDWASEYITALERGETVTFIAHGPSMKPIIVSGSTVTVAPLSPEMLIPCGMIVLVVMPTGEQFLHLVGNVADGRYLIRGVSKKQPDGWVTRDRIKGYVLCHTAPQNAE